MHVQIVKFKLKPETSREKFLALTRQMLTSLKEMEGFVAYELYEGPEHWSDRIAWQSEAHAQNGRNRFLTTGIAQQLVSLVDNDYDGFFGETVISA